MVPAGEISHRHLLVNQTQECPQFKILEECNRTQGLLRLLLRLQRFVWRLELTLSNGYIFSFQNGDILDEQRL